MATLSPDRQAAEPADEAEPRPRRRASIRAAVGAALAIGTVAGAMGSGLVDDSVVADVLAFTEPGPTTTTVPPPEPPAGGVPQTAAGDFVVEAIEVKADAAGDFKVLAVVRNVGPAVTSAEARIHLYKAARHVGKAAGRVIDLHPGQSAQVLLASDAPHVEGVDLWSLEVGD